MSDLPRSAEQADLHRAVGRIEGKLDALSTQMVAHSITSREGHTKLDGRIRKIEARNNIHVGAIGVLSAAFAAFVGWFKYGGGN